MTGWDLSAGEFYHSAPPPGSPDEKRLSEKLNGSVEITDLRRLAWRVDVLHKQHVAPNSHMLTVGIGALPSQTHPTGQLPQTYRFEPPALEGYHLSFRPASRPSRASCESVRVETLITDI